MSSLINNISSGVTTVLLTSSSSNPIGRALAGLAIYSTALGKAFSIGEMDPIFRIPYSATIPEKYLNGTTCRTEEHLFFLRNDGKPFRVLNTTPSTENRAEKSS